MTWWIWIAATAVVLAAGYLAYERFWVSGVTITSEPSGAEVRIDGRRVGTTPHRSPRMPPGVHRLELRHSHFSPHERRIRLEPGRRLELRVRLERGLGELVLYSNPRGAWVEIDGERQQGRAPLAVRLPSGSHHIVMGLTERRAVEETLMLVAGERHELTLDLDMDPHGTFTVQTVPDGARVELPGVEAAYVDGMRLPVGEYRAIVRHPGYRPADVRLQVRYGDNHHRLDLTRMLAPLTVVTDPADASVWVTFSAEPGGPLRRERYRRGMTLPVGPVDVRAAAMGRRSAFRRLDLGPTGATVHIALAPMTVTVGRRFKDPLAAGGEGPMVVVVPAGEFRMGNDDGPPSQQPAHVVTLTEPFAAGVYEVTVDEYRRFTSATGRRFPVKAVKLAGSAPMSHVTVADAAAYTDWLTEQTGNRYRLPSEAEWEYVAKAGSRHAFSFGSNVADLCRHANVGDRSLRTRYPGYVAGDCDDGHVVAAPVGSYPANAFGLHDVHGNVAEWVLECGLPFYSLATGDGRPIHGETTCPTHIVRGGAWADTPAEAVVTHRQLASSPSGDRGFRVIREL